MATQAGKTILEDAAIEVLLHHAGDDRTPLAVMFFKAMIVLAYEAIEMVKQHRIERGLFRVPLPIDLLLFLGTLLPSHRRQAVSKIAPPIEPRPSTSRK